MGATRFWNNLHKVRANENDQMVIFKCQMVLSEITDIDPLDLD